MGVFEKSQETWQNLKKSWILSVQVYNIPYFPKPSNGKNQLKILLTD